MTYTYIAIAAVSIAILIDLFIAKTRLITGKSFWTSYAIIAPFQLLTNWWLTSRNIVMYNSESIIGFRLAGAPIEDLFFGFALILSVLTLWEFWSRKEI